MEKLKTMVEIHLSYAKKFPEHARSYFDQAFGACQYYIFANPSTQMLVENLWNTYKPQFEAIVYGI